MDQREYIWRSNWHGSFYELAMEFHPTGDDARLLAALQALWSDPAVHGPLESPYTWPEQETTLLSIPAVPMPVLEAVAQVGLPQTLDPEGPEHLYGLLTPAGRPAIGIVCVMVREQGGSDWLDLCCPTGMLGYRPELNDYGSYETNLWVDGIDEVLLRIAAAVYAAAPFDLALIGEEVSGQGYAGTVTPMDLARGGYLLPSDLLQRLQPEVPSVRLSSDLHWFPYAD